MIIILVFKDRPSSKQEMQKIKFFWQMIKRYRVISHLSRLLLQAMYIRVPNKRTYLLIDEFELAKQIWAEQKKKLLSTSKPSLCLSKKYFKNQVTFCVQVVGWTKVKQMVKKQNCTITFWNSWTAMQWVKTFSSFFLVLLSPFRIQS